MKDRSVCCLVVLALIAACEGGDHKSPPPLESPATPTPGALWAEYQDIHEDATRDTTYLVGVRLDGLLTDAARASLTRTTSTLRDKLPPERRMPPDLVRQHMLGENVIARQSLMARYSLRNVDLIDSAHATLIVEDQDEVVLRLPVTLEDGDWRFQPSRDLFASLDEAMPLPSSPPTASRTFATPHDTAKALAEAFNTENGRLLYDLLDAKTRARFDALTAAAGGSTSEGALRIAQKLTRDAHARFGYASIGTVSITAPDRAEVVINYSKFRSDTFVAVREQDWRIALPL